jgi:hypothetical protein
MATWTDYVAKVSIINSGFSDLGEENESKSGLLLQSGGGIPRGHCIDRQMFVTIPVAQPAP